jgi:LysR family transcriptional regulator, glycine cleavage system transcriptional activator
MLEKAHGYCVAANPFMNRIPPIHALLAFESAARHGSMTAAAQELSVTPSAISHRIKQLEVFIGQTLIERSGAQWWLTAAGHDYLRVVRNGLAALQTLPRSPLIRRRLRVAVPPTFGRQILVPNLAQFSALEPDVDVTVQIAIPLLDLRAEDADVEVRFGGGLYADLRVEPLQHEQVFPVATPAYIKQRGPFNAPADLSKAALLRSPLEPWLPWFEAAKLDWPEPATGTQFNDVGLLMEACASHQGVALARPKLARQWLDAGQFVRLFDIAAKPPHGYWITYRSGATDRTEVRAFITWMHALMGES